MPISGGKYVAPTWNNGSAPAINAAELQAMSDTIAEVQNATFSQIVSYTGTNTYGSSNPCSITFDRTVDVILYVGYYDSEVDGSLDIYSVVMANESTSYQQFHGFAYYLANSSYGKRSADKKTYSWYNTAGNAVYQLNSATQTYYFLGLSGVS